MIRYGSSFSKRTRSKFVRRCSDSNNFVDQNPKGMPKPEVLQQRWLYEGFVKLREDTLMDECGRESKWISLQSQPISVCILAISKSGRLLVQREYRPSVGEFVLGLPGGMVEEGEGILQAAVRELLEETGYVFETWKVIGEAWPLPGIFTQKTVFAKAENFQFQEKPTLQEAEMILAPEFLSPNEIIGQARDHGFVDGQLLAGLSLLHFSDQ